MNVTLTPGPLCGRINIPGSKSQAHRLLICAALGTSPVELTLHATNADICATANCLRALGAAVMETEGVIRVQPMVAPMSGEASLPCGESGSTLRFLLPVVGALGVDAVFHREGRLPERPLTPLDEELRRHGMALREDGKLLHCAGRLQPGVYTLPGNVSSQYISGLLMALPRLKGDSILTITGPRESAPYIAMTEDALALAGIRLERTAEGYKIPGNQAFSLPKVLAVEGDWSSAAAFLCAGALSEQGVAVGGLRMDSLQADKAILELLRDFGAEVTTAEDAVFVRRKTLRGISIDAAQFPDLVPVLAALASGAQGETVIFNAARLRLKESDRLAATAAALCALGADVTEASDGLRIRGKNALPGGAADSCNDHRIAMAAAVAACICTGPVTVLGGECVNKSYPAFWDDLTFLKGGSL